MSSCNAPRLVRCRVRDLASCFYTRRLSFDEEPVTSYGKSPQTSNAKKLSILNPAELARRAHKANVVSRKDVIERFSSKESGRVSRDQGIGPEPRFAEDDYIIFRFREDGEIDMINDRNKSSSESHCEDDDGGEHENIISSTTLRPIINRKKGAPSEGIKEMINSSEQTNNRSPVDSFESCESNLSDTTSTDSFAFPELGRDWIGSPVHMPKSEKAGAPSLCLLCCSF